MEIEGAGGELRRSLALRIVNGGEVPLWGMFANLREEELEPGAAATFVLRCSSDGYLDVACGIGERGGLFATVYVIGSRLDGGSSLEVNGRRERLGAEHVAFARPMPRWRRDSNGEETFGAALDWISVMHLARGEPQPEATLELPDGGKRPFTSTAVWIDGRSDGGLATLTISPDGASLGGLGSYRTEPP